MADTIISVENLAKRYVISHQVGKGDGLRHRIEDLARAPFRWLKNGGNGDGQARAAHEEFWALKDVSFEIKRGEVVGIIGRNGAGKSTLLKILSRIVEPTRGRVVIDGRVASLLEVGTGFHQELTGRENIYLNGAILGMSKVEIKRKFDEIVAFAETEKFLDTPVKRYSSGMYVRLAFAVAAHLEPEILIVDEVLAVGDVQFQKKCLGKMRDVAGHGRTVLFVSHTMQAITTLCSRGILLDGGKVLQQGPAHEVANMYLEMSPGTSAQTVWRGDSGDENLRLKLARVIGEGGRIFSTDEEVRIQLVAEILQPIHGLIVAIEVYSSHRQLLAYSAHDDAQAPPPREIAPGMFAWELMIPGDTFASGSYEFRVDVGIHNVKKLVSERIDFTLHFENTRGVGRRYQSGWTNCFRPDWRWRPMDAAEIEETLKVQAPVLAERPVNS